MLSLVLEFVLNRWRSLKSSLSNKLLKNIITSYGNKFKFKIFCLMMKSICEIMAKQCMDFA